MEVLIFLVLLALLAPIYWLRRITFLLKRGQEIELDIAGGRYRQFEQAMDNLTDKFSEVELALGTIERKLSDIEYVTNIILQYKLPNERDRALLDQIEIDNEVSEGIGRARGNSA